MGNFFVPKHYVNVMHQNINGLISKSDLLSAHINELESNKVSLDVLCITEHNMLSSDLNFLDIPNYTLASQYSRENRHGGSCILVKDTFRYKTITEIKKFCLKNILECSAIELIDHNIKIICIYRPPKTDPISVETFFRYLNDILMTFCLRKSKIIVCGDFNIDRLKANSISFRLEQLFCSYNMKLEIKKPTRLSSGSCIDNFAHNSRGAKHQILELALSDHTAQLLQCKVPNICTIPYWFIYKRDLCQENMLKFLEYLNSLTFSECYNTDDPNLAFDIFYDLFKLLYDLCFPLIRIKINATRKPRWISKGIKKCCARKRQLLWKFRANKSENHKINFKNYSKRLKKIIALTRKAQNNYYIKTAPNKSKATWKVIQNSNKLCESNIKKINVNGNLLTNPSDIAHAFNEYFIGQTDYAASSVSKKFKVPSTCKSMFLGPTTPTDILRYIKSLKNTSSTGYDDISTIVIKFVSLSIAHLLSHIVNLAILYGKFPDKLKTTIIKPLYKKESKEEMGNYRPIALIPVFSKIYEKVINDSLYNYFDKNDLFASQQMGFRRNSTISMAIFKFLHEIMNNLDKGATTCALFMDLKKAFDYVDHSILLDKLYSYGVRGNTLSLIKSYLSDRLQITKITNIDYKSKSQITYTSSTKVNLRGVPQGSVLGPLLFIIYINDFPSFIQCPMSLFADDCNLIFTDDGNTDFEAKINTTLMTIVDWLTSNKLILNFDKTKIMTLTNKNKKRPVLQIQYTNHNIAETETIKFLGLQIDQKLNWKAHVESVCTKLHKFSYALYMLAKIVNKETLLVAYNAYVVSVLRYGIIFWGNSVEREHAFKAQKRCIRSICGLKQTDSCKPYFKELKILTLPCLYIYESLLFAKKHINMYKHVISIRHKHKLSIPQSRTAQYSNSAYKMLPKLYNKLPAEFFNIHDFFHFKSKLKDYLLRKCYYTIAEYLN